MSNITKGQVEAQISEAIIRFEKEYMGRGPTETKDSQKEWYRFRGQVRHLSIDISTGSCFEV